LLIVGERLNTTRKAAAAIVAARDAGALVREATRQKEAGAAYLDVNAGTFAAGEGEALGWMVETIQGALDVSLCIDTSSPAAMAAALRLHRGKALCNSITLEEARLGPVLDLVRESGSAVVALCLGDDGRLPAGSAEAAANGLRLVDRLLGAGVPLEDIYLDPLVRPIGTDPAAGVTVLETIRRLKAEHPRLKTICGLSNISFGLPRRAVVNRAFLVAAMAAGLDAAILDPLDRDLMALLAAARAVLGQDRYGLAFVRACRRGAFDQARPEEGLSPGGASEGVGESGGAGAGP